MTNAFKNNLYPEITKIESIDAESSQSETVNHGHAPFIAASPIARNLLVESTRAKTQNVTGYCTINFMQSNMIASFAAWIGRANMHPFGSLITKSASSRTSKNFFILYLLVKIMKWRTFLRLNRRFKIIFLRNLWLLYSHELCNWRLRVHHICNQSYSNRACN